MITEWKRELQGLGFTSLQIEAGMHICKGSPHPLRICDLLFAIAIVADMQSNTDKYISRNSRARGNAVIVSYKRERTRK